MSYKAASHAKYLPLRQQLDNAKLCIVTHLHLMALSMYQISVKTDAQIELSAPPSAECSNTCLFNVCSYDKGKKDVGYCSLSVQGKGSKGHSECVRGLAQVAIYPHPVPIN